MGPVATRPARLAHPYAAGEEGETQETGQFLAPIFTMYIYAAQVVVGQLVRWGGGSDFLCGTDERVGPDFRSRLSARRVFGVERPNFDAA